MLRKIALLIFLISLCSTTSMDISNHMNVLWGMGNNKAYAIPIEPVPEPDTQREERTPIPSIKKQSEYVLNGHTSYVHSVAFSPDGKRIASGSDDKTIRIWDVLSGQQVQILNGHTGAVNVVMFSSDGKTIISGGDDESVRLWDSNSGMLIGRFPTNRGKVYAIGLNSFGMAAVGEWTSRDINFFNIMTGQRIRTISEADRLGIFCIAFHPNGRIMASSGSDEKISLWDSSSGQIFKTLMDKSETIKGSTRAVSFSPNGIYVASAGEDETIRIWDVNTGSITTKLKGHPNGVHSVAFSPNGRYIASAGGWLSSEGRDEIIVGLWDVTSGKLIKSFKSHQNGGVTSVAFSPDGRRIASASLDKTVRVYDVSEFIK